MGRLAAQSSNPIIPFDATPSSIYNFLRLLPLLAIFEVYRVSQLTITMATSVLEQGNLPVDHSNIPGMFLLPGVIPNFDILYSRGQTYIFITRKLG